MSESVEVKKSGDELLKIAVQYFAKVSGMYPASQPAQAAQIALSCLEDRLSPIELGDVLLRDDKSVDDLLETANRVHAAVGKGPKDAKGQLEKLNRDRLVKIIRGDFGLAEQIMVLSPEQIIDILSHYPDYPKTGQGVYRNMIFAIIDAQKKERLDQHDEHIDMEGGLE